MEYNEKEILEALRNEKAKYHAFSQLVEHYREPLYWRIRRIVIAHEDANDVLQNTFIKVWSNMDKFQMRAQFSTWINRIAINESLDFLRSKKDKISTDEYGGVAIKLLADDYFDGDATQALLQEAIATLPEVQRTVFNLRYFDEMKYNEMSQVLGTSEGALKASYHLAVKKICDFLKLRD